MRRLRTDPSKKVSKSSASGKNPLRSKLQFPKNGNDHFSSSPPAMRNSARATTDWQFTTKDARIKLRKLYPIMDG